MSDDWFDKTYRSEESTPGDLDDRVLNAARRATRQRWSPPVVAGAAVAAALAVYLVIPTFDEVEPSYGKDAQGTTPPATQPGSAREPQIEAGPDADPAIEPRTVSNLAEALSRARSEPPPLEPRPSAAQIDLTLLSADTFAPSAPAIEAPGIAPPTLLRLNFIAPMTTCIPDVLTGPIGGPGRHDQAAMCPDVDGGLNIDFVWDGPAPCPARLVVQDAANALVILDGAVVVVGEVRYRCIDGEWATRE